MVMLQSIMLLMFQHTGLMLLSGKQNQETNMYAVPQQQEPHLLLAMVVFRCLLRHTRWLSCEGPSTARALGAASRV